MKEVEMVEVTDPPEGTVPPNMGLTFWDLSPEAKRRKEEADDAWVENRCCAAKFIKDVLCVCLFDKMHDGDHQYSPPLPGGGYLPSVCPCGKSYCETCL